MLITCKCNRIVNLNLRDGAAGGAGLSGGGPAWPTVVLFVKFVICTGDV